MLLYLFTVTTEKMTKKKSRFGTLPKMNMPMKCHESKQPEQRRTIVKHVKEPSHSRTFKELCQEIKEEEFEMNSHKQT